MKKRKPTIRVLCMSITAVLLMIVATVWGIGYYYKFDKSLVSLKKNYAKNQAELKLTKEITSHYAKNVVVSNDAPIYKDLNINEVVGYINKDNLLLLEELKITHETKLFSFKINNEVYNIDYQNVTPTELVEKENQKRYEHYVPFNENIITNDKTRFYKNQKEMFTLSKSFEFEVYIKDTDSYGIIYNGDIYYVKKEDVKEVKESANAKVAKAKSIATIVYHAIYETEKCDTAICHPVKQVQTHLNYLKENNYFTLTMNEFEMFIDKKLNVQTNSILITIDDGQFSDNAKKVFTDNKMNVSIFAITGWFDPKSMVTDYVEVHSHSDLLHNLGDCPTGQGGAIQCWPKDKLLADLKISREKAFNTTAFCYPFYEYNQYSIEVLKEAGFTMGFAGLKAGGSMKAYPGYDKFRIPRITFLNTTTVEDMKGVLK